MYLILTSAFQKTLRHDYRTNIPHRKQAAVLILLYEKADELRVLLTTRSKTMRTHPGQTALPGGKMDDTDKDCIETAVSATLNTRILSL